MSDYTPTTEEVREAIAEWTWSRRMFRPELAQSDGREFDRWCAEWEAEQGETEWEYKNHWCNPGCVDGCADNGRMYSRRVHPWLPVPDTTNNESEGKA